MICFQNSRSLKKNFYCHNLKFFRIFLKFLPNLLRKSSIFNRKLRKILSFPPYFYPFFSNFFNYFSTFYRFHHISDDFHFSRSLHNFLNTLILFALTQKINYVLKLAIVFVLLAFYFKLVLTFVGILNIFF